MRRCLLIMLFFVFNSQLFAQGVNSFKELKGESEVEVVFDFSVMKVMKDNFTEEEYITKHKMELNKKLEDSGELWETSWRRSKEELWQPKFLLLLNKYTEGKIKFRNKESESKYILKMKVTWVYPGWDAGVMRQVAKVTSLITLYERANPDVILVSKVYEDMPGNQFGSNFNNETRIAEGFAKTGKTLGKTITSKIK